MNEDRKSQDTPANRPQHSPGEPAPSTNRELVSTNPDRAGIIDVQQQQVDISSLPIEVQNQLKAEHARQVIESQQRLIRMGHDVQALKATLDGLGSTGAEMAQQGVSFTATNTKDDHLGRTEIMIGNSEAAQRGKFTRTQVGPTGAPSPQILVIIGLAIAAVTIIAVAMAR